MWGVKGQSNDLKIDDVRLNICITTCTMNGKMREYLDPVTQYGAYFRSFLFDLVVEPPPPLPEPLVETVVSCFTAEEPYSLVDDCGGAACCWLVTAAAIADNEFNCEVLLFGEVSTDKPPVGDITVLLPEVIIVLPPPPARPPVAPG